MARLSRDQAIAEMVNGGELYIYVETERGWRGWPKPGSGAIVGDNGLSHVGQRTVRAIMRLETRGCPAKLTDDAKRRAIHGASPIWFWQ